MNEIKEGSVVTLKGQHMPMAVGVIKEDIAFCIWFDRDNRLNSFEFDLKDLELSPTEEDI